MLLQVKNVTKKFRNFTAVENISFELEKGDMFGFLGKNGAGKSTTFRLILGLLVPTSGEIFFDGKPFSKDNFDQIGFLPEERGLHTKLTVEEELIYMGSLKNMKKKELKVKIDYWLEKFEILQNKKKKISDLSKGNQQKIQLIASIMHNPKLLILDEPFSGLDPINVELLKAAIKELNTLGTTIIFSSHRLEHIEELCNKVGILKSGKLEAYGSVDDVKSKTKYKHIIIESKEDFSHLQEINGVKNLEIYNNTITLKVTDENTCKLIFNEISKKSFVKRFQILEPTIKDIFIEIMKKETVEKAGDVSE
ncbi:MULTISPECIES: ABC transporter ATP-binding protein [Bacillus cereus group]|nr:MULTISPECIES: ATP-binding cassette domain-containing protein [Bacillus cereus group]AKR13163.1 sodium ABC transporter ATP-binding protein [Bacillus thuringiensis]MDZ4588741.1 ATP-binding cassette domain-containing protein [Bacillus cereus]MDZ4599588.1 ATP-binding cassette domain-containing protein [Bacillus cereus]MED2801100.1 ATP-binding cassette domain-containing protein [Bacillus thuringiensis]WPA86279.1 ATP-binding cassette domain-containing protein [Bacillus cereus]